MNRETLRQMGLTDEQIESVMAEHSKGIHLNDPPKWCIVQRRVGEIYVKILRIEISVRYNCYN